LKIFGRELLAAAEPLVLELPPKVDTVSLEQVDPSIQSVSVDELTAYLGQTQMDPFQNSIYDGGKFAGGFGPTQVFEKDYWTLRARSIQLFEENLYAKGLIRRLITNEINTGLAPEACPDEAIIGLPEDSLNDWTETVENRWGLWGKNPLVCDWKKTSTFGQIQRDARMAALIEGDVLVVLRQNPTTKLPTVQLISGSKVRTPIMDDHKLKVGNTIKHGVELNKDGSVVAYWINQEDGSSERLPTFSAKSGRRISWLVFGTEKMLDEVRGTPLLAVVLQSLKEIDRYRDSTQRKATVNSLLAAFVKKTKDKPSSLPMTGGATRKDSVAVTDGDGTSRQFNMAQMLPGVFIEELQTGEEPVPFSTNGTDVNFGEFEESIIQAVAWANNYPPEIVRLAFSNNYSASQAAINELKIYLNLVWGWWGETFCAPIFDDYVLSEVLIFKILAPGFVAAWRDPNKWDIYGAWLACNWYGSIKPSTDMLKAGKGAKLLVDECWSTNAQQSRGLTGTKFSKNVKRIKRENQLKADAMRPMLELQKEFTPEVVEKAINAVSNDGNFAKLEDIEALTDIIEELTEEVESGSK